MANTLIVYYSLEGNIDFVARTLAKELGADTFRLETVKAYPKTGLAKFFHGGKDAVANSQPELKAVPDVSAYQTIVVGAPVWAGRPAAPINTLFANVDVAGKNLAAFASSAGGSATKTLELIAEKAKGTDVVAVASFKNPARNPESALADIKAFAEKIR